VRNNENSVGECVGLAGRWTQELKDFLASVRFQRKRRSLRLVESLSLGEKRSVVVVAFEDRRYVLGLSASSIALVDRLEPPGFSLESNDAQVAQESDFAAYFQQ
jgi:flagellar biogenesis protein FliO